MFRSLPAGSQWGILVPASDPLCQQGFITREMIPQLPLIMHQRLGLQNEIAHWAGTDLEDLKIAATYNVVHGSPTSMVLHELGYFLTTRDLLEPVLGEDVRFLPLKPQLSTRLALVWKKHAVFSQAAKAFLELLG